MMIMITVSVVDDIGVGLATVVGMVWRRLVFSVLIYIRWVWAVMCGPGGVGEFGQVVYDCGGLLFVCVDVYRSALPLSQFWFCRVRSDQVCRFYSEVLVGRPSMGRSREFF